MDLPECVLCIGKEIHGAPLDKIPKPEAAISTAVDISFSTILHRRDSGGIIL